MGFRELAEHQVVMFSGKGGAGKSTLSAATATFLSAQGYRTLILSTDPAPSLSDVFEVQVGDTVTRVGESLYALELSPSAVLRRWKQKFGDEVYEVLSSFLPVDRGILEYIGSAPGIDEEFTLDYIWELVEEGGYDRVVWDTAPAGHTLRLLKMPGVFIEHLNEAVRVYTRVYSVISKMRDAIGGGSGRSVFDIIEGWRRLSEELLDFLRSDRVELIPVCTPQRMSVAQVLRLVEELRCYGIGVRRVVVNHVLEHTCEYHRAALEEQRECIAELEQSLEGVEMLQVPEMPREVRGRERLQELVRLLFG